MMEKKNRRKIIILFDVPIVPVGQSNKNDKQKELVASKTSYLIFLLVDKWMTSLTLFLIM